MECTSESAGNSNYAYSFKIVNRTVLTCSPNYHSVYPWIPWYISAVNSCYKYKTLTLSSPINTFDVIQKQLKKKCYSIAVPYIRVAWDDCTGTLTQCTYSIKSQPLNWLPDWLGILFVSVTGNEHGRIPMWYMMEVIQPRACGPIRRGMML